MDLALLPSGMLCSSTPTQIVPTYGNRDLQQSKSLIAEVDVSQSTHGEFRKDSPPKFVLPWCSAVVLLEPLWLLADPPHLGSPPNPDLVYKFASVTGPF